MLSYTTLKDFNEICVFFLCNLQGFQYPQGFSGNFVCFSCTTQKDIIEICVVSFSHSKSKNKSSHNNNNNIHYHTNNSHNNINN